MNIPTKTVVDIGSISFTGNIIPNSWYKNILRPNGKPYLEAIVILSEIIYWYRPREDRDERSGDTVSVSKRFRSDKLQKSYQQLSDKFGFSKDEAKYACHALKEMGLIRIEFRTIESDGVKISNVTFLEPNPIKIQEINNKKLTDTPLGAENRGRVSATPHPPPSATPQVGVCEGGDIYRD